MFAQDDWLQKKNFCNPPFTQLNRLTKFIQQFQPLLPQCVIITPKWTQQPWHQQLKAIADDTQIIPQSQQAFQQINNLEHPQRYLKNSNW